MRPSDPAVFQLPTVATAETTSAVHDYLTSRRLAAPDEALQLERPGASNMNCVWRARLPGRSLILKQARPWVEKYPSIAAPVSRAEAEARFYELAGREPDLAAKLPPLLDHDRDAHLLVLGDLAPVSSLENLYAGGPVESRLLDELASWTGQLHHLPVPADPARDCRNTAMRALNHAHIFDLPLRPGGVFDAVLETVTPGLGAVAAAFRADSAVVECVTALGRRYLEQDRPGLIHGDLFPGSLLVTQEGALRVIDPEFSFGGDPEFDLGVFHAHLLLSGQPAGTCARWLELARGVAGRSEALLLRYAGAEIMRRLIGIAQLPLRLTLEEKRGLLALSRRLLLTADEVEALGEPPVHLPGRER